MPANPRFTPPPYSVYKNLLASNAANDSVAQTAYNNLQYGNDSTGSNNILATSADFRALGLQTPGVLNSSGNNGGSYDGIIYLNSTDLTGFNGSNSGPYTASAVIQHEVDEVLGIGGSGSTLRSGSSSSYYGALDLFRYSGLHTPSYTTSSTAASYFSIDGGATNIVAFNQNSGGDFGDWGGSSSYVQLAFTGPGSTASVSLSSPEGTALQAIGYDPSLAPIPSSLVLLGSGAAGLALVSGVKRRSLRKL